MAKAAPLLAMDENGTLADNAPVMVLIRLTEMVRFAAHIGDPNRVQELHNMRIAAKRLRYTLEIFQPCFTGSLAKEYKAVYDRVKSIQEQIGEIHDCDVRGPAIQTFLDDHARRRPEIRIGLERLIAREKNERDRMYAEFIEYWAGLCRKGFRARIFRLVAALETGTPPEEEAEGASA
ncbi:MAG: CHAD domain-containing protein [Capsulimonadaceae bacterium]|nr:CHAD domain-containing protein [Capsulimonadaceae bacterium]